MINVLNKFVVVDKFFVVNVFGEYMEKFFLLLLVFIIVMWCWFYYQDVEVCVGFFVIGINDLVDEIF